MNHLLDAGLLIIRAGVGLSYIWLHGLPKLLGGTALWEQLGMSMRHLGITFAPVFWGFMGAFAESACALLLALGLLFRPAAALLAITMIVATVSHVAGGDGWPMAAHALHMATLFIGLVLIGPGRYSLDARLALRKRVRRPLR